MNVGSHVPAPWLFLVVHYTHGLLAPLRYNSALSRGRTPSALPNLRVRSHCQHAIYTGQQVHHFET